MDSSLQPEQQPRFGNNYGSILAIVVVIIFIVVGGVWYYTNTNQPAEVAQTTTTTTPVANSTAINNDTDLQSASADLDSSDVNTIDTSLTQNDTDSATF